LLQFHGNVVHHGPIVVSFYKVLGMNGQAQVYLFARKNKSRN
jgi:hypothetical protein